jgi:hypothetical protein
MRFVRLRRISSFPTLLRVGAAVGAVGAVLASALAACGGDDSAAPPAIVNSPDAAKDGTTTGPDQDADMTPPDACVPFDDSGLSPAAVEAGLGYVMARRCGQCHTEKDGGTLAGHVKAPLPNTMVYPANLTSDPMFGLGCWSDDDIVQAILTGVDDQGQPLCPQMPRFSKASMPMHEDEARAIVAYLRSLDPVPNQVPQSSCPMSMPDGGRDDGGKGDGGGKGDAGDAGKGDGGKADAGDDAGQDAGGDDGSSGDAGTDATGSDASDADTDAG